MRRKGLRLTPGRVYHGAMLPVLLFCAVRALLLSKISAWNSIEVTSEHTSVNHRAFICITGQVSRLELDYKVRTLLIPLRDAGYTTDVALVLSENTNNTYWTKPKQKIKAGHSPSFASFADAVSHIREKGFHVTTRAPYTPLDKPVLRDEYVERLRKKTREEKLLNRAENHARIWGSWTQCYKEMIQSNAQYDFVIRIREDHGFTRKFEIEKILPDLKPSTFVSTDCSIHGGVNDRFAIVATDSAYDLFHAPFETLYRGNISDSIHNPETFIFEAYKQENLSIVYSPKIRGLEKIQTDENGAAILMDLPDSSMCIFKMHD